jgi:hypothetical protein
MQAVAKGLELGLIDDALRDLIAECAPELTARMGSWGQFNRERIRVLVLEHMREGFASMTGRVA